MKMRKLRFANFHLKFKITFFNNPLLCLTKAYLIIFFKVQQNLKLCLHMLCT